MRTLLVALLILATPPASSTQELTFGGMTIRVGQDSVSLDQVVREGQHELRPVGDGDYLIWRSDGTLDQSTVPGTVHLEEGRVTLVGKTWTPPDASQGAPVLGALAGALKNMVGMATASCTITPKVYPQPGGRMEEWNFDCGGSHRVSIMITRQGDAVSIMVTEFVGTLPQQ